MQSLNALSLKRFIKGCALLWKSSKCFYCWEFKYCVDLFVIELIRRLYRTCT